MTAKIIDGKKIADGILNDLKSKIKNMKEKPGLALVLVGNNPASEIYVTSKEKDSKEAGLFPTMTKAKPGFSFMFFILILISSRIDFAILLPSMILAVGILNSISTHQIPDKAEISCIIQQRGF